MTNDETADILGAVLEQAAQLGIDAGNAGTAEALTAKGIAGTILTESRLADRTTVHQHRIAKVQAEASVAVRRAQIAEAREVSDILKVEGREVIVKTLDLGEGTWVVQTENGTFAGRADWTVIHNGKRTSRWHYAQDEALLRAIELRHGGGDNDSGYVYAARVLSVPLEDES